MVILKILSDNKGWLDWQHENKNKLLDDKLRYLYDYPLPKTCMVNSIHNCICRPLKCEEEPLGESFLDKHARAKLQTAI